MPEIDTDTLELIERRIAERVTESVERTLKWRYGIVLVVFTAVAGVFGWNLSSGIKTETTNLVTQARQDFESAIKDLRKEAEAAIKTLNVTFGLASELGKRVAASMDEVDRRVREFDPKVDLLLKAGQKVDDINGKVRNLEAESEVRLAQLRSVDLDLGRIGAMDANLTSLAKQVATLQELVGQIPAAAEKVPPAAYGEARDAVESIVAQSSGRAEQYAKPAALATVFFQFAGGQREQARELSSALRLARFQVPGEERTAGAAGQHEVRYFYDGDQAGAQELALAVNLALSRLGYRPMDVVAKDFTGYPRTKPREGTLELWLDIPPQPAGG